MLKKIKRFEKLSVAGVKMLIVMLECGHSKTLMHVTSIPATTECLECKKGNG